MTDEMKEPCCQKHPIEADVFCHGKKEHKGKHWSCGRYHSSYTWD